MTRRRHEALRARPRQRSLLYLVPPVAVLTVWVRLGEMPTTVELIGGLIVITGVVIVARGKALRERWHQRSRGERAQLELVDAASRSWSFERSSSGG